MKKAILLLLVITISLFGTESVYAQDSSVLNLEAVVVAGCSVFAHPMHFGNVTGAAEVNTLGDIEVTCGYDVPYQVSFDAGTWNGGGSVPHFRSMAGTGPVFVSYDLTDDIGTPLGDDCAPSANPFPGACLVGFGMDVPEHFTVSAQLQPFSGIPGGTILSDDVIVTVHY